MALSNHNHACYDILNLHLGIDSPAGVRAACTKKLTDRVFTAIVVPSLSITYKPLKLSLYIPQTVHNTLYFQVRAYFVCIHDYL